MVNPIPKKRYKRDQPIRVMVRGNWYDATFVKYSEYKGSCYILVNGKEVISCTEYIEPREVP